MKGARLLRIVHTPVRFAPAYGGVEKYVTELSRQQVRLGHQVTVVCADEPHSDLSDINGVRVIRLPYLAKVANTNITRRLFHVLRTQDFDVIHTHIPTPWSADISALVSRLKKKPLYVTYHNDLTGQGVAKAIAAIYNATFLHLVLRQAQRIIITQSKYAEYSDHLARYKNKILTIPPGVTDPLILPEPARRSNQIFFMSVLDKHHEYKGLGVLLNAMVTVINQWPDARLIVGGGGELVGKYRRLADELGIGLAVDFAGYVSDQRLAELYSSSSVFVLPSLNNMEGFGIVALEALSYGTPVITTELAGCADFIRENRAGAIVRPNDQSGLAAEIVASLTDSENARAMGARGSKAVTDRFSWLAVARQVDRLYQ